MAADTGATADLTPLREQAGRRFATTHWSIVAAAGESADQEARQELCRVYWGPLYAYVRRRGHAPHDAEDLTQEFFARLLAKNWVARADEAKGRFRTFLLTAMSRFLANEWDKSRAAKRGGGRDTAGALFSEEAKAHRAEEPADSRTPEQAYERRWALALLDQVILRLQAEFQSSEKAEQFEVLKPCLVGDGSSEPHEELARRLNLEPGAVKVAVHRLRRRYRELLRQEVGRTVASATDVDAEMRHLFKVLGEP